MCCYFRIPLLSRQLADVSLACLLFCKLRLDASVGIIEEESHAKEQP